MRRLLVMLLAIPLVGAVAMATYMVWTLLAAYWASVLGLAYLGVAGIAALIWTCGMLVILVVRRPPAFVTFEGLRRVQLRNPATATRVGAVLAAEILSGAVVWPAALVVLITRVRAFRAARGRYSPSLDAGAALTVLRNPELLWWISALATALIFTLVAGLFEAKPEPVRWVLVALYGAFVGRLLLYVSSADGLPGMLRRSRGNPFARAVLIATAATLTMAYTLSALRDWHLGEHAMMDRVQQTMLLMFNPAKSWTGLVGGGLVTYDAVATLGGLLLVVTAVRTLLQMKKFYRTTDDLAAIARHMHVLGQFSESFRWLDQVKVHSGASLAARAVAFAGVNRVDEALLWLERSRATLAPDSVEMVDKYVQLLLLCVMFPMPKTVTLGVLERYLRTTPSDRDLAIPVVQLVGVGCLSYTEVLVALNQGTTSVSDLRYPLTELLTTMQAANGDHAYQLAAKISPRDPVDRAMFAPCALLVLTLGNPSSTLADDTKLLVGWLDGDLRGIESLARTLPDVDRLRIGMAIGALIPLAAMIATDRVEELQYVSDSLLTLTKPLAGIEKSFLDVAKSDLSSLHRRTVGW